MNAPRTNKGVAVIISPTALVRVLAEWTLDRYVSVVLKHTDGTQKFFIPTMK